MVSLNIPSTIGRENFGVKKFSEVKWCPKLKNLKYVLQQNIYGKKNRKHVPAQPVQYCVARNCKGMKCRHVVATTSLCWSLHTLSQRMAFLATKALVGVDSNVSDNPRLLYPITKSPPKAATDKSKKRGPYILLMSTLPDIHGTLKYSSNSSMMSSFTF